MARAWTVDEDEVLRRDYRTAGAPALADRLGRTVPSVRLRAQRLGLSRVNYDPSRASLARLRDLKARGQTDAEVAAALGVTRDVVRFLRRKLKIPDAWASDYFRAYRRALAGTAPSAEMPAVPWRTWTEDEDEVVRRCYAVAGATALADRLGRTAAAIRKRAEWLEVARPHLNPDKATLARLRDLKARGRTDVEVAAALGTTENVIGYWRRKLKIPGSRRPKIRARL